MHVFISIKHETQHAFIKKRIVHYKNVDRVQNAREKYICCYFKRAKLKISD